GRPVHGHLLRIQGGPQHAGEGGRGRVGGVGHPRERHRAGHHRDPDGAGIARRALAQRGGGPHGPGAPGDGRGHRGRRAGPPRHRLGHRTDPRLRRRLVAAQSHQRLRRVRPVEGGPTALNVISAADIGSYAPDPERYRPTSWPSWVDELDLSVGEAHVRMALHGLRGEDWLCRDELAATELALRARLLQEQRHRVFACLDTARGAADEAASLVFDWLATRGVAPLRGELDPLAGAAMSLQDDLCVMVRRDGGWHLDAAALCFPSMWSLVEKLGLPTVAVHAPVAHYRDELAARVDT